MTAAGNLPEEELLIDILTRCPVKSLVRFRIWNEWRDYFRASAGATTRAASCV
ncbi:F-box protein [Corchorus olitorius]|uniref:F-box protein n=1 Tax=Corchorus olitorius TaxID=93759 RepID=A0A1R3KYI1_9ROSI|nr:F-box protein [Corchorus olitorius]